MKSKLVKRLEAEAACANIEKLNAWSSRQDAWNEVDRLKAENETLKEIVSYIPKLPTEAYSKTLVMEILALKKEIESLKSAALTVQNNIKEYFRLEKDIIGRAEYEFYPELLSKWENARKALEEQ